MVGKVLAAILSVLVLQYVECENPPVFKDSFIAWGEIVQPLPDTEDLVFIQADFEECYDASTKNAAFFLRLLQKNVTFVKNYEADQTFEYVEIDGKMKCSESNEKEWIESDLTAGLLAYEDSDGRVKFSLTQLLNLPDKYLLEDYRDVAGEYRGIPSTSWTYEIKSTKKEEDDTRNATTLMITSFWSSTDDTQRNKWNTTAAQTVIPLGFNVSKIIWSDPVDVEDYVINVFGFVPNAYDHKYFEPYEGVVCPTRKSKVQFPNVKNIKAISLHSEMALPDYQELRYIDVWFDPRSQLVRVDLERLKDENPVEKKKKHYQSEVAIGKMGVVFRWSHYKGEAECEVIPFSKYENDFQNLFDIKQDLKNWQMGKIFGLNDTSYVYIGKTTKNDIPCHLFQGERNDWPDKNAGTKSLWEWCFNINMTKENDVVFFDGDEFGLVSGNVIILSAKNTNFNGYRMNHHFYEVKEQDPKILDATSFDISRCFLYSQMRALQFYLNLDIVEDNRHLAENATSDISFLQKWKTAIYMYSGLQDYSLRISGVRAAIDDSKIYIRFTLLDVHKDLPSDVKEKQISASEAEKTLKDNINDGKLTITHSWTKGEVTTFQAAKQSLSPQIDPNFKPQTLPPPVTHETTSTLFPFSLIIDTTTPSSKQVKTTGHTPGAVAGVSIAMLLIGITIGSSGTFYKLHGLPSCLRR